GILDGEDLKTFHSAGTSRRLHRGTDRDRGSGESCVTSWHSRHQRASSGCVSNSQITYCASEDRTATGVKARLRALLRSVGIRHGVIMGAAMIFAGALDYA